MWFLQNVRHSPKSKKIQTAWIILILTVLIAAYFFWWFSQKTKNILLWSAIWVTAILWADLVSYEIDFPTLRETWSIQESRKTYNNWIALIWNCSHTEDLNCDNFETQSDAQRVYEICMDKIVAYNQNIQEPLRLDVYGLDWDKDGIVCEHLK